MKGLCFMCYVLVSGVRVEGLGCWHTGVQAELAGVHALDTLARGPPHPLASPPRALRAGGGRLFWGSKRFETVFLEVQNGVSGGGKTFFFAKLVSGGTYRQSWRELTRFTRSPVVPPPRRPVACITSKTRMRGEPLSCGGGGSWGLGFPGFREHVHGLLRIEPNNATMYSLERGWGVWFPGVWGGHTAKTRGTRRCPAEGVRVGVSSGSRRVRGNKSRCAETIERLEWEGW